MHPEPEAEPNQSAIQAAVSLLADRDRRIAEACRLRLLGWGDLARPALQRAASEADPRLRTRARQILRTLDLENWLAAVRRFGDAARRRSRRRPSENRAVWSTLEEGVLLVASLLRAPDRAALTAFVEDAASSLRPRIVGRTPATGARLLAEQLARGAGLTGERTDQWDADALWIDRVVVRRRGQAAALALLYLLVARRAGLDAAAVCLPEHFLVRVHGPRPILIDPAHEGRLVTKADCLRYLRASGHGIHAVSYLEDASDLHALAVCLRALHGVFGYREDREVCIAIESARTALLAPL